MNPASAPAEMKLQGYLTPAYPCSYLPKRGARSQVAVLRPEQVQRGYDLLIQRGFRRSGSFVYSPHCEACAACTAMRLPVAQFTPSRSQKRANAALTTMQLSRLPLQFSAEHFALYQRYQHARHDEAIVAQADLKNDFKDNLPSSARHNYEQFLLRSPIHSELLELRALGGELLAVSIIDWVSDGVSAVYTFYEPKARGSLGTSAIMWMLALAQQAQLPYVYLGYWVSESPKMAYKSRFQPAQVLQNGVWQAF